MKDERLVNVAMTVLVCCALVVTGLVVRRELFSTPIPPAAPMRVEAWREYARSGNRMGSAEAAVTLVMFSDFQCRFCAVAAGRIRALRREYPNDVAVIYRHFPLRTHPHAVAAARASECAGAQGQFEAYHDALFLKQDSIGAMPWVRYATEAGVADLRRFERCVNATSPVAALERDTLAGARLEVRGTPTILINETRIVGTPPLDTLRSYVERALASHRGKQTGSSSRLIR